MNTTNTVLYLNCFSGISGDMMLGVLLDVLGTDDLETRLKGLALENYSVNVTRTRKEGITGLDVKVICDENHPHRGLGDILDIIDNSEIAPGAAARAKKAFRLMAEAEGSVHGMSPEDVHFHEVGAVDSIVDIVGSSILMEELGPDKVVFSALNVGSGTVHCAHGEFPVPAPATIRLLEGVPVFSNGQPMERVTPTGAVLARVFADSFGVIPPGVVKKTGYGIGDHASDLVNVVQGVLLDVEDSLQEAHAQAEGHVHAHPHDHDHHHDHHHDNDHHHDHDHDHVHVHDHEHEHEHAAAGSARGDRTACK